MPAINDFLLKNELRILDNPCVSPDFCLDWPALGRKLSTGGSRDLVEHAKSLFATAAGTWTRTRLLGGESSTSMTAL